MNRNQPSTTGTRLVIDVGRHVAIDEANVDTPAACELLARAMIAQAVLEPVCGFRIVNVADGACRVTHTDAFTGEEYELFGPPDRLYRPIEEYIYATSADDERGQNGRVIYATVNGVDVDLLAQFDRGTQIRLSWRNITPREPSAKCALETNSPNSLGYYVSCGLLVACGAVSPVVASICLRTSIVDALALSLIWSIISVVLLLVAMQFGRYTNGCDAST